MPEPRPPYRLTASFPYLLARAGVRMGELFARELAEIGMTLQMYRAMAALWERDGQRLSELSVMINVEMSTLSRLISQLKSSGWVSRARQQGDERSVTLSLTPAGRKRVQSLIPRAQHYEAMAVAGFAPDEVAYLKTALEKVLSNLGTDTAAPSREGRVESAADMVRSS